MDDRRTRDFSAGPVWDPTTNRWLVGVRYPDGSRRRKRFRRERAAQLAWAVAQTRIDDGTWDQLAAKHVKLCAAFDEYRKYSEAQHRSYKSSIVPALRTWEQALGPDTPLAKITPARVEAVKLQRVQKVSRTTVDKDLGTLKAFFNWAIARNLAVSNPVRRVKMFHEDNTRLRYLTRDEYDRLIDAAKQIATSPYLVEKIVLAAHTGLRRGSLFSLRWDQIDFANRVMRIPRTKSGRPLSVPLNQTALDTLQQLHASRNPTSPWVFPHKVGPNIGEPIFDIKNAFHAAIEAAGIENFTWHDLRHTFASWLMMRGASLRSVAELLGHTSLKMTMRYAHLSPAFLQSEVSLLDPPKKKVKQSQAQRGQTTQREAPGGVRARKGQLAQSQSEFSERTPDLVNEIGSSGWTRTSNPPVNSLTQVLVLEGSSLV
jgi:integrase